MMKELVDRKESLLMIIRQGGGCAGILCNCCMLQDTHCTFNGSGFLCKCTNLGDRRSLDKKELAITIYIELYGKESLVEELI